MAECSMIEIDNNADAFRLAEGRMFAFLGKYSGRRRTGSFGEGRLISLEKWTRSSIVRLKRLNPEILDMRFQC